MLAGCESHLSPFCAVDQVLGHFQDRFIKEVVASDVVFDLKNKGIIPDGVHTAVNRETSATRQSQILYEHLEKTSTKKSLMTVCDIVIDVSGNPRMRAFGEDMKDMVKGKLKWCVCSHMHSCMRVLRVYLHDPISGAMPRNFMLITMWTCRTQPECAICRPL